jgi:hypothetical protein
VDRHAAKRQAGVVAIGEYIVVILGSSVGVALINWIASSRTASKQREATALLQATKEEHEGNLQRQTEEHAARLRREAAHDEARATFLPLAEALVLYFTKEAYDLHWEEVGIFVFPSTERPILDTQAKVVDAARSIMWGHPTGEVRDQARAIYDSLVSYWFDTDRAQAMFYNDERQGLSQEEANDLEKAAEKLIQLVHAEAQPTSEMA